jgi:hypothetical protein
MIDVILLLIIILLGLKQLTLHEEIGDIQQELNFLHNDITKKTDEFVAGTELGFYDPFCENPGWYKCRYDGIAWSKVKPLDRGKNSQ